MNVQYFIFIHNIHNLGVFNLVLSRKAVIIQINQEREERSERPSARESPDVTSGVGENIWDSGGGEGNPYQHHSFAVRDDHPQVAFAAAGDRATGLVRERRRRFGRSSLPQDASTAGAHESVH